MITVVIPAYNEESSVYNIVMRLKKHASEVIVVDDGSVDYTVQMAEEAGAKVILNERRWGYIETIKAGFWRAENGIIVTIDAEVPIEVIPTDKPRRIAWHHIKQIFCVIGWSLKKGEF